MLWRKATRVLAAAGLIVVIGLFLAWMAKPMLVASLSSYVRKRCVNIVRERFDADVAFGSFSIESLYPQVKITGGTVTLTKQQVAGLPPLIFVQSFSVEAQLEAFLRKPAHVQSLKLAGMRISVPPRSGQREDETRRSSQHYPVVVDTFECGDCELNIIPKRADKAPLRFLIHSLKMEQAGLGRSAPYQARLTNAVPRGEIQASGRFGPWQPEEPSVTPLSGHYVFSHANLDPFPGIGGTLDSTGQFEGVLERIVADGQTSTPNFSLDVSGHPLPLNTTFHAIIDGTSGDTALDPVRAKLQDSTIVAHGGVFGMPEGKGRAVLLEVVVQPARLQDLLWLGIKSDRPPLVGNLRFHTQLAILPGRGKISQRMKLNGHFSATSAESTNPTIQAKLKKLSRRAEGKVGQASAGSDVFDLTGNFHLDHGIADLRNLQFTIPGAALQMDGRYGLRSEELDFEGTLFLDAKLSQTVGGLKSILLKPVDPFFRKRGKTVLPITITGFRSHPKFRLELHRRRSSKEGRTALAESRAHAR